MSQPPGNQRNPGRLVADRKLVVPRGDGPVPFKAVDAALDRVPSLVVLRVEQRSHGLSVSEYSVLDVLARQDDYHLRMNQLSNAVVLSQSATTRLVSRLEARGLLQRCLCPTDRRGIYSEATKAGRDLLAEAQPTHDAVLTAALVKAAELTELAPLVEALAELAVPAKL